jgi:hypothetical protein
MTVPGLILDGVKFVLGAFVGAVITKRVEGKAQLVSFWGHASACTVSNPGQPPYVIHTHDVVIRNAGKKPANNVRISHAVPLPHFNINPSVPYTVETLPGGHQDIVIPKLIPGQQIVISYLYSPPLLYTQIHAGIRSDEGFATPVEMELRQKTSTWAIALAVVGFVIGCLTVLYLIWRGLRYLGV